MNVSQVAQNLHLNDRGLWVPETQSAISYPEEGNSLYFTVEQNSFWFRHRNRCLVELLKRFPLPGTLFDIGGGNGFVSLGIQEAGYEVVLLEPGPQGAVNALQRGIKDVACSTLEDAGFRPASIGAAGCFDVVEHIEDDASFLSSIFHYLQPGGRFYLTVPAYSLLWSHEDVDAGHFRRYNSATLAAALQKAGFAVEYQTYIFQFLTVPILLLRTLPHKLGARKAAGGQEVNQNHSLPSGAAGRLITRWLEREIETIRAGNSVGHGTSCLAVARKPL